MQGDAGNWRQSVTFAYDEDGYLQMMQTTDMGLEMVLLSPAQVDALRAFLASGTRWRERLDHD